MDSHRMFFCARPDCRRLTLLCTRCDRGNLYCTRACWEQQRALNQAASGKRYQDTFQGRCRHAARQKAYRARKHSPQKVTHQGREPTPSSGIVPAVPGTPPPAASPSSGASLDPPRCCRCGRVGRFLRHHTLARTRPP